MERKNDRIAKGKSDSVAKEFAKNLRKDYLGAKIILFGSRASGNFLEDSDYDFIIVSEKFEGKKFFNRMEGIYDYWHSKEAIEPLCYTPKEFSEKSKRIGIVREAVEKGIAL